MEIWQNFVAFSDIWNLKVGLVSEGKFIFKKMKEINVVQNYVLSRSKQTNLFLKKLGCVNSRMGVLSDKEDSYLYFSLKLGQKWKHFS